MTKDAIFKAIIPGSVVSIMVYCSGFELLGLAGGLTTCAAAYYLLNRKED